MEKETAINTLKKLTEDFKIDTFTVLNDDNNPIDRTNENYYFTLNNGTIEFSCEKIDLEVKDFTYVSVNGVKTYCKNLKQAIKYATM